MGILGGTFNPIHNAHLQMAELAIASLHLDRVLLMVAADPPHKSVDGHVAAAHRYAMTQLAAKTVPGVEACDLELQREGKSYMSDTLALLHEQSPADELYLILGSDMLLDLKTWHCPETVMRLAIIAAVARQGQQKQDAQAAQYLESAFHARIELLAGSVDMLSSTCIRDRLEAGLPVEGMLPPEVERYCYEEGLYFPSEIQRMQQALRETLTPKRYRHTMGVVRTAASLAQKWGADPLQARMAALLHDCAKNLDPETLHALSGDDTGIASVQHAFAGAAVAKDGYGVTDERILHAIRLHSTGDADMTLLDKVTYLADLTEPNRNFPCVDDMRKLLDCGPDEAMYRSLLRTRDYVMRLQSRGEAEAFHPAGERALAYFQQLLESGKGRNEAQDSVRE